jgi:hypothetical protein
MLNFKSIADTTFYQLKRFNKFWQINNIILRYTIREWCSQLS